MISNAAALQGRSVPRWVRGIENEDISIYFKQTQQKVLRQSKSSTRSNSYQQFEENQCLHYGIERNINFQLFLYGYSVRNSKDNKKTLAQLYGKSGDALHSYGISLVLSYLYHIFCSIPSTVSHNTFIFFRNIAAFQKNNRERVSEDLFLLFTQGLFLKHSDPSKNDISEFIII